MLVFPTVMVAFLQFCFIDGQIRSSGLRVTLAIFSGRRDPVWSIPMPAVGDISRLLANARIQGFAYSTKRMPARLGFKGFVVQEEKKARLLVGRETTELQLRLLQTMPKDLLKSGTRQKVQKAIRLGAVKAEVGSLKYKRYAPPYDPDPWHVSEMVIRCNNCYNYANIILTNNVALPGSGSGQEYEEPMTGQTVQDAAVRDGLEVLIPQPTDNDDVPGPPAGNRHLVALVVDPAKVNYDGDFHWYRLDSDGKWSHKPGECHVEREDDEGKEITDPRRAAMGDYKFVSFMTSDKDSVTIEDDFECPYNE